jgi:hypothetical protein
MRMFVFTLCSVLLSSYLAAQAGWRDDQSEGYWSARGHHNTFILNGRIWILNGFAGTLNRSVWSSNDGSVWTEEVDGDSIRLPWSARHSATAIVYNGRVWMFGGSDGGGAFSDVWSSADGVNWVEVTSNPPWIERSMHSAVVFDNRMWLMGGHQSTTGYWGFSDVWYTTDGVDWTQASPSDPSNIWPARFSHRTVVFNDRIWVLGGRYGGLHYNDVWSSPDGKDWIEETSEAPWSPRVYFSAEVYADRLWVIGGVDVVTFEHYGDAWSTADGVNWRYEGSPWHSRRNHTALVYKGRLWTIGGWITPAIPEAATFHGIWSYGVHVPEPVLPDGRPGYHYSTLIKARAGEAPYTWTFAGGELPPGLILGNTNTATLPISGTPEMEGTFTFTLQIEESNGDTVTEDITITIAHPPPPPEESFASNGTGGCNPAPAGTVPLILLGAGLAAWRWRRFRSVVGEVD